MKTKLEAIAFKASTHPKHRFRNMSQLLDVGLFKRSWGQLKKDTAPGVDGLTAKVFKQQLSEHIITLVDELKADRYRTNPIKRIHIPKASGKTRPLGLPTLKDKLCQHGVASILNSIWEQDFLPNSYGYRPKKSAHGAIYSLRENLQKGRYSYIVEADIKGFFDTVDHGWLMKMLEHRIDDKRFLKLINQWLKVDIIEDDKAMLKAEEGTPQGGVISPVLANIYLHYVLDLWFSKVVKPRLNRKAMLIRYCDDFVVAFESKQDAERFFKVLPQRLKKFGLDIAPEKTQLLQFSRFYPERKKCFTFLGFDFYWNISHKGYAILRRKTTRNKQRNAMSLMTAWIKANRHKKISVLLPCLKRKLIGFSNYFGIIDNSQSVVKYYFHMLRILFKWLNKRSQVSSYNWAGFNQLLSEYTIQYPKVRKPNVIIDWY